MLECLEHFLLPLASVVTVAAFKPKLMLLETSCLYFKGLSFKHEQQRRYAPKVVRTGVFLGVNLFLFPKSYYKGFEKQRSGRVSGEPAYCDRDYQCGDCW